MFKPLSIFIGLRYVRCRHGNGFSSFISASSTIGIALGVMVLIVVLSAMNGFERVLAKSLLSIVPHAEIISVNSPIDNWRKKVAEIEQHASVSVAAPVIKMSGMMQHGKALKGVEIRGVDVELEAQVSSITNYITSGSWQSLVQPNQVVLGSGVAKKLGVKQGDSFQVLLPQAAADGSSNQQFPVPLKVNLIVGGIFKFGGTIDDSLAYISIKDARAIKGYRVDQVEGIRIAIHDVFNAPRIAREIAYQFDHYVYIYDWTRTQGHLFSDIQLVRMVMFIVLVLVIAVASFNIVSTLIMAVNEKKSDIAILKTMGASPLTIMGSFMLQGLINGILGCVIGAGSGVYLALNLTDIVVKIETLLATKFLSSDVYFIDFLPSHLQAGDVIATLTVALLMSFLATIYPAWRATKIDPAQVLGQS